MKEILNLVKSEEAMHLLDEVRELEKCFEAKSFTIEEEKIQKNKQKEMLRRIKLIMKEGN